MKTPQDLADEIDSLGVTETTLLLDNDFQEDDWEIDKLSPIKATINNQTNLVVESIIEAPIGNHVYGKDINKKITIKDNDLDIKRYEDNVEQKVDTLLRLNRGDIPETPTLGKNISTGKTVGNYNYAECEHRWCQHSSYCTIRPCEQCRHQEFARHGNCEGWYVFFGFGRYFSRWTEIGYL